MTLVIIPALNEEKTVQDVAEKFAKHPCRPTVIVAIDKESKDRTWDICEKKLVPVGVHPIKSKAHGKGEVVTDILRRVKNVISDEIVFCDADIFISDPIIDILMMPVSASYGQMIMIPKYPNEKETKKAEIDTGLTFRFAESWAWVSGVRRVKKQYIPLPLHGYLMETQINNALARDNKKTEFIRCGNHLISPLRFTPERVEAIHHYGNLGKELGIL